MVWGGDTPVESLFREKGGVAVGVAISGWDSCELLSCVEGEDVWGGEGENEGEGVRIRGESELYPLPLSVQLVPAVFSLSLHKYKQQNMVKLR